MKDITLLNTVDKVKIAFRDGNKDESTSPPLLEGSGKREDEVVQKMHMWLLLIFEN